MKQTNLTQIEIEDFLREEIGFDHDDAEYHAHDLIAGDDHAYGYTTPNGRGFYVTFDVCADEFTIEEITDFHFIDGNAGVGAFLYVANNQFHKVFAVGSQTFQLFSTIEAAYAYLEKIEKDSFDLPEHG